MKIVFLIVEDDLDFPILIKSWLKNYASFADVEVIVVQSMDEAKKIAKDAAVILLDLLLPDSTQKQSLEAIVPDLRPHAPVIVVTGTVEGMAPADSAICVDAVRIYGAAAAVPKVMTAGKIGMEWLMLLIQTVWSRRIFEQNLKQ